MSQNRNERCQCGSGQKFKNCCANKAVQSSNRGAMIGGAAIVVLVAVGAYSFVQGRDDGRATARRLEAAPDTAPVPVATATATTTAPSSTVAPPAAATAANAAGTAVSLPPGSAAPPGPTPPGKVWSAAHGHWHTAGRPQLPPTPMVTPTPMQISANTISPGDKPQPGPAPAGKVWSPQHGHWHDAPAGGSGSISNVKVFGQPIESLQSGTANIPAPPGAAPAGKVWSPQHGHWHDLSPAVTAPKAETGTAAPKP